MNKNIKTQNPSLPKGFVDRDGREVGIKNKIVRIMMDNSELWGYELVENPSFELTSNLFGSFLPEGDKGVFTFQNKDEPPIGLKFDQTIPLMRFYSSKKDSLSNPYKRMAYSNVFRIDKPGVQRYREFSQFDLDIVNDISPSASAELISLTSENLIKSGLDKSDFLIVYNSRKILDGLLSKIKVKDTKQVQQITRNIDKLERLGIDEVSKLLKSGRKDSSGAFQSGCNLSDGQADEILNFLKVKDLSEIKNIIKDDRSIEGINDLERISELVDYQGYKSVLKFSSQLVRGISYYAGEIFEINLTFNIKGPKDETLTSLAIGGGGFYSGLVSRFQAKDVPAVGISLGIDRIVYGLNQLKKIKYEKKKIVGICTLDRKYLKEYYEISKQLKNNKINCEIYLGNLGLKFQLKYFDKKKCPIVIIAGENEFRDKQLLIKNLVKGKVESDKTETREEWKKAKDIQISIPKEDLIKNVKKYI